jgi:hypothetical protein
MFDVTRFLALRNPAAGQAMVGQETAGANTLIIVNSTSEYNDFLQRFGAGDLSGVNSSTVNVEFPSHSMLPGYVYYRSISDPTLFFAID